MKRLTLFATLGVAFLFVTASDAMAQNALTTLSYNVSGPVSDMKDFVGGTSWRGVQIKGSGFRTENVAFGLSAGWQVFDETTTRPISVSGTNASGDLTGNLTRYINAFPIMVSAQYFLGESRALRPFVSLGAGFTYVTQRLDSGIFISTEERFHFALAPEAGVLVPAGFNSYLVLAARYDHAFKAGNYVGGTRYDFQYWTVKFGIAWEPGF